MFSDYQVTREIAVDGSAGIEGIFSPFLGDNSQSDVLIISLPVWSRAVILCKTNRPETVL
jgi:hypothetical protein